MCWKSFEGRATQLTRCQLPTQSNVMQIKPGRALYVQELQEIEAMVAEDRKIEAMTEGGAFRYFLQIICNTLLMFF